MDNMIMNKVIRKNINYMKILIIIKILWRRL